jgi:hypothetical protein
LAGSAINRHLRDHCRYQGDAAAHGLGFGKIIAETKSQLGSPIGRKLLCTEQGMTLSECRLELAHKIQIQ